jgi:hypothetical protein
VIIHSFGVSSESILAPLFGILFETVVALHAFRPVAVSLIIILVVAMYFPSISMFLSNLVWYVLVKNREYVIIHSFGVSSESILAPLFGILYALWPFYMPLSVAVSTSAS